FCRPHDCGGADLQIQPEFSRAELRIKFGESSQEFLQHRVNILVVRDKATTSIHMLLDLKERRNGSELTVFIRQSPYRDIFENLGNGDSLRTGFNDGQEIIDRIQAELKQRHIDAGEVVMEGTDGDT